MTAKPKRVGFYPCCGHDVREPLVLLRDVVDIVVFCDTDSRVEKHFGSVRAGGMELPEARFENCDAREALKRLERVDVLFYRRDSGGEGGSGVTVNSREFLGQFVRKLPPDGGYLVTDGSNERNNVFRTMNRSRGLLLDGWRLKAESQDMPTNSGLVWIRVWREDGGGEEPEGKAQA